MTDNEYQEASDDELQYYKEHVDPITEKLRKFFVANDISVHEAYISMLQYTISIMNCNNYTNQLFLDLAKHLAETVNAKRFLDFKVDKE